MQLGDTAKTAAHWCTVVQLGAVWLNAVQLDAACFKLKRLCAIWCNLVQFGAKGPDWCSLVQIGACLGRLVQLG